MNEKESKYSSVHITGMYTLLAALIGLIGVLVSQKNCNGEANSTSATPPIINNQNINQVTVTVPHNTTSKVSEEPSKQNIEENQVESSISTNQPTTLDNFQNDSRAKNSYSKEDNFSSYINSPSKHSNISVIIIDANGNLSTPISNAIADIYRKTGKSASIGLIKSSFLRKPEFKGLFEGDSKVIEKLKISSYTDYLAIGKINYSIQYGNLSTETIVCSASISMSIISTKNKSIEQNFTILNANANGVTESQAQENALQKLLNRYYNERASL